MFPHSPMSLPILLFLFFLTNKTWRIAKNEISHCPIRQESKDDALRKKKHPAGRCRQDVLPLLIWNDPLLYFLFVPLSDRQEPPDILHPADITPAVNKLPHMAHAFFLPSFPENLGCRRKAPDPAVSICPSSPSLTSTSPCPSGNTSIPADSPPAEPASSNPWNPARNA